MRTDGPLVSRTALWGELNAHPLCWDARVERDLGAWACTQPWELMTDRGGARRTREVTSDRTTPEPKLRSHRAALRRQYGGRRWLYRSRSAGDHARRYEPSHDRQRRDREGRTNTQGVDHEPERETDGMTSMMRISSVCRRFGPQTRSTNV